MATNVGAAEAKPRPNPMGLETVHAVFAHQWAAYAQGSWR